MATRGTSLLAQSVALNRHFHEVTLPYKISPCKKIRQKFLLRSKVLLLSSLIHIFVYLWHCSSLKGVLF